jgi:hypothetical protein
MCAVPPEVWRWEAWEMWVEWRLEMSSSGSTCLSCQFEGEGSEGSGVVRGTYMACERHLELFVKVMVS